MNSDRLDEIKEYVALQERRSEGTARTGDLRWLIAEVERLRDDGTVWADMNAALADEYVWTEHFKLIAETEAAEVVRLRSCLLEHREVMHELWKRAKGSGLSIGLARRYDELDAAAGVLLSGEANDEQ